MEMPLEFYHNKLLELLSSLLVKSNHHTYQEVGEILEMEEQKTQEEVKEEEMWQQEPMTTNSRWPKYSQPDKSDAERLLTLDDFPRWPFSNHVHGPQWEEMSTLCSRILLDESVHRLIYIYRLSASTVDKLVPVWCPHPTRSASCPRLMASSPIHHEMYRTSINGLGEWVSYIEEPLSSLPHRKANCSHRNNLDIANAQSDVETSPSSCLPDSSDRLTPT